MPGDLVVLVSVHGYPAAELLREVLIEGGVENVDIRASVGTPYVARAVTVEYDVRVADEDEARARALLAAYSEEASIAANAQADEGPSISEPAAASVRLARKQRSKVAVAAMMLAVFVLPVLLLLLSRAADYVRSLF